MCAHTHPDMHACVCMHIHPGVHACACAHAHPGVHMCVCAHAHPGVHACMCAHAHMHTHKSISQYNKDILTQPTPFWEELFLHLLVRNLVYSKLLHLIF